MTAGRVISTRHAYKKPQHKHRRTDQAGRFMDSRANVLFWIAHPLRVSKKKPTHRRLSLRAAGQALATVLLALRDRRPDDVILTSECHVHKVAAHTLRRRCAVSAYRWRTKSWHADNPPVTAKLPQSAASRQLLSQQAVDHGALLLSS